MIDGWMRWVKKRNEHVEKCMMHESTERKCEQVMKKMIWYGMKSTINCLGYTKFFFDAYDDFMNLIK